MVDYEWTVGIFIKNETCSPCQEESIQMRLVDPSLCWAIDMLDRIRQDHQSLNPHLCVQTHAICEALIASTA